MEFYDKTKLLYLETNASGVELQAGLIQTTSDINCPRHIAPKKHTQTHHICEQGTETLQWQALEHIHINHRGKWKKN